MAGTLRATSGIVAPDVPAPPPTVSATYPVFASYAQRDRDPILESFVVDLSDQIGRLTGAEVDAVTFFDRAAIANGDDFERVIVRAVNAADVLVCLMSPTYFQRPWCGREVELFLSRLRAAADEERVRYIFPIWWMRPARPRPLPRALARFHNTDAGYPADYESRGVYGMARMGGEASVGPLAYRLAYLIAETLDTLREEPSRRLPPCVVPDDVEAIPNAFDEQRPYDIRLLTLATNGDGWRPSAAELTVRDAAALVATQRQLVIRLLEVGTTTASVTDALAQAHAEHQIPLLVVDAAAAEYRGLLAAIDALELPNLAVLLVDAGMAPTGAAAWLSAVCPNPAGALATAQSAGRLQVAAPGRLAAEMERVLESTRLRAIAITPAARAESADLAAQARASGIEVDLQPTLSGPTPERAL